VRTFDSATAAYLDGRTDIIAEYLLWIEARDRDTGDVEAGGLWTGGDDRVFTVDGEERTYYGAGSVLAIPDLEGGVGLEVRQITVGLSHISPEVQNLVRAYDARLAPMTIHKAFLRLDSREPVAPPIRVWRGWVNAVQIDETAQTVDLGGVSDARRLTRGIPRFKSAAALALRSGTDRFRDYADTPAAVQTWWGETRGSAAQVSAPTGPSTAITPTSSGRDPQDFGP